MRPGRFGAGEAFARISPQRKRPSARKAAWRRIKDGGSWAGAFLHEAAAAPIPWAEPAEEAASAFPAQPVLAEGDEPG